MATSSTTRRGNGAGWGGPARGASTSRIKPGDPDGIQTMSNDAEVKARAAQRVEALKDHLFGLATKAERQETQLAAAVAYLNRVEGMPIARTVTATVADPNSLTDADLAAIIARGSADPGEAPVDPPRPDGVVH